MKGIDYTLLTERDTKSLEIFMQLKPFLPQKEFNKIQMKMIKSFIKRNRKFLKTNKGE